MSRRTRKKYGGMPKRERNNNLEEGEIPNPKRQALEQAQPNSPPRPVIIEGLDLLGVQQTPHNTTQKKPRGPKAAAVPKQKTNRPQKTVKKILNINETTWKEYLKSATIGIQLNNPTEFYYYLGSNMEVPKVIIVEKIQEGIIKYRNISDNNELILPTEVVNELVIIPKEFFGYVNNNLIPKITSAEFKLKKLSEIDLQKEILFMRDVKDDPINTTHAQVDVVTQKFILHSLYLNKLPHKINTEELKVVNPVPIESEFSSIRDLFINPLDGTIIHNDYYRTYRDYAFLRNLIDFLHDYNDVGVKYKNDLVKLYITKHIDYNHPLLNKWLTIIQTKIVTIGNKASQIACRTVTKELIEEYCTLFSKVKGMEWIIPKKEDGKVLDANLTDEASIKALLSKINTNGTKGIFVESINANIDVIFKLAPSYNINYIDIKSGDWDGGSGYGFKKAEAARQLYRGVGENIKLMKINVNRTRRNNSVIVLPHHDTRTLSEGMFGIFDIHLNQYTLTVSGPQMQSITMVGPQMLSVNAITKLVGEKRLRGNEGTVAELLKVNNRPEGYRYTGNEKLAILTLKQWTDTIQTLDSLQQYNRDTFSFNKYYIGVIYNDILAEMAGQFEGAKCSILNSNKKIEYYCYDKRALVVPPPILRVKQLALVQVLENKDFLNHYLNTWFEDKIKLVNAIHEKTSDPAIFFPSILMLNDLQEYKAKSIAELKSIHKNDYIEYDKLFLFPTTVEEYITKITQNKQILLNFNNEYCSYNKLIYDITQINLRDVIKKRRRANNQGIDANEMKQNFYTLYDSQVKQKVIESLQKQGILNIKPYIGAIFAYSFFNKIEIPGGQDVCEGIRESPVNKALKEGYYKGRITPTKRTEAQKMTIRLGMGRYIRLVLNFFATIKSNILQLTEAEMTKYSSNIEYSLYSGFDVYKTNFNQLTLKIVAEKGLTLSVEDNDLLEIYLEIEKAIEVRSKLWEPDNDNVSNLPFCSFIEGACFDVVEGENYEAAVILEGIHENNNAEL